MNIKVISYNELLECKSQGESIQLVDLREPYELEIEGLSDAIHLPMGELMDRIDEIPTRKQKTHIMRFFILEIYVPHN